MHYKHIQAPVTKRIALVAHDNMKPIFGGLVLRP